MHVLIAQGYVKILFRLVVGTMVLKVEIKIEKEVLKAEIRVESAAWVCWELYELGLLGGKSLLF